MASDSMAMTEIRLDNGRHLLEMTDQLDFGAVAAAWVQDSENGHWWYLLVTPMVDNLGPTWIYERLLKVFQKWKLPAGISPLDIRVASPFESGVQNLFSGINARMIENGPVPVVDINIGNGLFVRAIVPYRMMTSRAKKSDSSKAFDRKVLGLLAA